MAEQRRTLTQSEVVTICNALWAAADVYAQDSDNAESERLREEFDAQAQHARRLAELLENAESVTLEGVAHG